MAEAGEGADAETGGKEAGGKKTPEGTTDDRTSPGQPPSKTRYFGSKQLQSDRYASDFKKLADEILAPLAAASGVELKVTVEVEATGNEGFDDSKVRTVSENASTLKFGQSGFEEG